MNQLIFSVGMFVLLWINYRDGIISFHLKEEFLLGQSAFFFIGLARIVDLGTGVNSQIIYTSVHYRVEVWSGIVLVVLTIPLNYWLARRIGLTGPAIADLITFFFYNGVRYLFLYRKYNLQPFSWRTLYVLVIGVVIWFICDRLFGKFTGFLWIFVRSIVFVVLYGGAVLWFRLSEDILPVWQTIKKRLGLS
jgi:O-antigen/teichoic acid export membrane protein